ncbi:dual specificity protein phosphatase 22-A isoform X1 [Aplysia californica]|uniref:Dual specificity protein phosphatase 22-A isoform X1 n=1 Tax=Aplysia californica TaxID=6500 RepID=A0ABM0JFW1_APLCA|nr:dual specificity protein phosphatase 22-A isoform X1 [Aplysia californica]
MGNGMNKILPGLYIGNFRDAKDEKQLSENSITHIVSIHDNAKKILEDKEYLCILASDTPDQDLSKFFPQIIRFIHKARLDGGSVLVHCLAGVSRSVTVTAAYIMTVTELGWRDSLNAIRGARSVANPNFGFQKQLQAYDHEHVVEERKKLRSQFPHNSFKDEEECRVNLRCFQHYIMTGDLPSRSDDLYPLPHRAYQSPAKKESESSSSKNKVDTHSPSLSQHQQQQRGRHRHHHHHHHHHHHRHQQLKHRPQREIVNEESNDNHSEDRNQETVAGSSAKVDTAERQAEESAPSLSGLSLDDNSNSGSKSSNHNDNGRSSARDGIVLETLFDHASD